MADARIDDRDLRLLLGALEDLAVDAELTGPEQAAYERLCKVAGRKPRLRAFEQQSLGLLGDDDDRPSGGGVMSDYIERTRHFFRGGEGMPWPPKGAPSKPPEPDVAKQIAEKMARASHDAATGKTPPPSAPAPKRALTDEEKRALREALGDE